MFLNNKGLKYAQNLDLPKGKASSKALEEELEKERQKNLQHKKELEQKIKNLSSRLQKNLKVLDTLVRSGQELNIDGDLLLLNRVNSGATIKTTGSLIVTQVVDGAIRCNGDFMMLKASPKANIVFHNVEVDNTYLKDRLNRVELINNEIRITPVLKETNWAK
jgi:septum site-determining protein MinC